MSVCVVEWLDDDEVDNIAGLLEPRQPAAHFGLSTAQANDRYDLQRE